MDAARWRWMLPTVVGLAAVTALARFAGEWLLFAVAGFWVVPLMIGYEMTRPALRNLLADRVAAAVAWTLTVGPWVGSITVLAAAALVPGLDGVAIGPGSGSSWILLPWFFAGVPAMVVPWAAWHVLRARGRPRERGAVLGYLVLFLVLLGALAELNSHWTGQRTQWGPWLVSAFVLGVVAMLLHGYFRILAPAGGPRDVIEPPTLPDLAPRD